jgi:transcriptional regulator with XRE-family HTH domain
MKTSKPPQVESPSSPVIDKEALAKFISARMDALKLSINDIHKMTASRGAQYSVSAATVHHLRRGNFDNPKPRTLRNIAIVLEVDESQLLNIAYGRGENGDVDRYERREISLPTSYWQSLYAAAEQHKRTPDMEVEALVAFVLLGESVNIDEQRVGRYKRASRNKSVTN